MAHVEKRGPSRWRARYRAPDGQERSKTFTRRVDAERFLTSVEHQKLVGGYVDPAAGRVTFRSYAEQWRTAQPHRDSTVQNVEQDLRLHIYPTIGDRPIGAVRTGEVQALITSLVAKVAPATLERIYGRVTAVFRSAVRDRVITSTPCVEIRLPRHKSAAVTDVLTTDHVMALAGSVPARYRALVIAGAGLGLRPGELFGLARDRIDFLRRSVKVDQQMRRVRGAGVELGPLKTEASYRTVPLPSVVGDTMAAHLAAFPPATRMAGEPWADLIFTNERGAPIQQFPFSQLWATARTAAQVPSWATPHDLRHHYASVLIRSGASVKVIQARLGHASAKTTLDVYGHLFPDEADRTRDAVDAALVPASHQYDRMCEA